MAHEEMGKRLMAGEVKTVLNEYIRMWVETGLIGLSLLCATGYLMLRRFYKQRLYGAIAACIAVGVCSLASYPFLSPIVQILCVFLVSFASLQCKKSVISFALFDPKDRYANQKRIVAGAVVGVLITMLFFRHTVYARDLLRWKDISDLQHQTNEYHFREEYQMLYQTLHGEARFLHDYAARLQSLDDYRRADTLLRQLVSIQPTYKRYLMLGYNHEAMDEYDLAESAYKKAANILPNAFIPKYMLLDLYRITDNGPKATAMAKYILDYPVKVKNEDVSQIKNEAINYLNNINQ